jgi:hypothetical protein
MPTPGPLTTALAACTVAYGGFKLYGKGSNEGLCGGHVCAADSSQGSSSNPNVDLVTWCPIGAGVVLILIFAIWSRHRRGKGHVLGEGEEALRRAGFLRKVYGILTVQLMVTVALAAACMYIQVVRETLVSTRWPSTLTCASMFLSLVILKFVKDSYPSNYIMLAVFTVSVAISIGTYCAILEAIGRGHIVLQASSFAILIFFGLTVYTLLSGRNFSFIGGFLSMALWGLVLWGFAGLFFPALISSVAYGFIGALVFCIFILFDTSRLMHTLSYDDYIQATIELYLDIINLFLYISKILIKKEED